MADTTTERVPERSVTNTAINVNVLPRDLYEELSSTQRTSPYELYFITSAEVNHVVIDLDKIGSSGYETSAFVTSAWVADYVQQAIAQAMA